jgi:hypothetical protein
MVVGKLLAADATLRGSVVLAGSGTSLLSGTSVDTGSSPAAIALKRGGIMRVCPSSSVNVSASPAQSLMLSLSTGSIETSYRVGTDPDTIVTPDFRILLAGPAEFHFEVGTNARGDTCLRPTAGNSGAIFVSELLGGGSYQVKPNEGVLFRGGKVADAAPLTIACGCPTPPQTEVASAPTPPAEPGAAPAAGASASPQSTLLGSETAPVAAPQPGQTVVQVDAPFVFNAVAPGPPLMQVATLRFQSVPEVALPIVEAPVPAPVRAKSQKKGFFGRIGSFFSSWFHKSPPAKASSPQAVVE